jgi:hypothetical protein
MSTETKVWIERGRLKEVCSEPLDWWECITCGEVFPKSEWQRNEDLCPVDGGAPRPKCLKCGGAFNETVSGSTHPCKSIAQYERTGKLAFEDPAPAPAESDEELESFSEAEPSTKPPETEAESAPPETGHVWWRNAGKVAAVCFGGVLLYFAYVILISDPGPDSRQQTAQPKPTYQEKDDEKLRQEKRRLDHAERERQRKRDRDKEQAEKLRRDKAQAEKLRQEKRRLDQAERERRLEHVERAMQAGLEFKKSLELIPLGVGIDMTIVRTLGLNDYYWDDCGLPCRVYRDDVEANQRHCREYIVYIDKIAFTSVRCRYLIKNLPKFIWNQIRRYRRAW